MNLESVARLSLFQTKILSICKFPASQLSLQVVIDRCNRRLAITLRRFGENMFILVLSNESSKRF